MSTSRTLSSTCAALLTLLLQAQAPDAFNYQAVVRTATGQTLSDHSASMRFALHQGSPVGTVVFDETHATTTNEHGLINLQVGTGSPITGTLGGVEWKNGPYFLEVSLDTNSSGTYTSMGTQQLLSVPYALHAGSSNVPNGTSVGQTLHWNGATWVADSAIFSDGKRFGIGTLEPEGPLGIKADKQRSTLISFFEKGDMPTQAQFRIGYSGPDSTGISIDEIITGENNSRLFIQGSTGNIGIGTTEPQAPLSIEPRNTLYTYFETGDIPTEQQFRLRSSSGGHDGLSFDQGTGSSSSRLFIASSTGHIGIGHTEPEAPLSIEKRSELYQKFENGDIPTGQDFAFSSSSQGHPGFSLDQGEAGARSSRLFVDAPTGFVGIGTTQPDAPLSVERSSTGVYVSLTSTGPGAFNPLAWKLVHATGPVLDGFSIDDATTGLGVSRLFIQESTGFVGLGTTTPSEKLHVEASTGSGITGLKVLNTASVGNQGWKVGHLQDGDTERDGAFSILEETVGSSTERVTIRTGGNVGINEVIPDTRFHVSLPTSDASSSLDLIPGTGIATIGPMTDNVVFDYRGLQARHGEYVGDVLNLTATTLNLQRMGGDILLHGDASFADAERLIFTSNARLGLGTMTPIERLDVNGAIRLGTTTNENAGTIRFTGTDFEGRVGGAWRSLSSEWQKVDNSDMIHYSSSTGHAQVGINEVLPYATLHVSRPQTDPLTGVSLQENTGILLLGAIEENLAMDSKQIQARTSPPGSPVLALQPSTLHLQPLGGDLILHSSSSDEAQKVTITSNGLMGLGKTPIERLDVNGAITIGTSLSTNEGTIRFTGSEFQGRSSGQWRSLGSPWEKVDNTDNIYYDPASHAKVGIGLSQPNAMLHIRSTESSSTDDVVGAHFELIGSTLNMIDDRKYLGLKVYTAGSATGSGYGALIENTTSSAGTGAQPRVGVGINCSGVWSPNAAALNIGLYVKDVSGQSNAESNLAAVLNGNVVIGDVTASSSSVGTGGGRVLSIQNGTAPSPPSSGLSDGGVQLYVSTDANGISTLHVMRGNGEIVKLYREAPLSPPDGSSVDGTYDASEEAVINNMRTRIDQLENTLKALGLLTP